ncbi:MAG: hypothetical protein P3W93_006765 [Thermus sp.]|nr:hypothetical protein [Thermus sp.]
MRIMKLGIYIWRIEGVFEGLGPRFHCGKKGDEKLKMHISLPHRKNWLSKSPSGHPDKGIIPLIRYAEPSQREVKPRRYRTHVPILTHSVVSLAAQKCG